MKILILLISCQNLTFVPCASCVWSAEIAVISTHSLCGISRSKMQAEYLWERGADKKISLKFSNIRNAIVLKDSFEGCKFS